MTTKPFLCSFFRSSCSWRLRIALALKGIDYEYRTVVQLVNGEENIKPEYLKMNPMGQVPLLHIDGHSFVQSLPTIEYLDETRPEPPLLPKDPVKRAQVRALAELINSGIQPIQNIAVLEYVEADKSAGWSKYWINNGFTALEKMLQDTSGKCCLGDTVTMADLFLVPQVYNAILFGVDVREYPLISQINDYLLTLDAFTVSHPRCQPDTPPQFQS